MLISLGVQPRPPRRKKDGATNISVTQILREVLHEPRRVLINGKPRWVSGAEVVIRQAYARAERGNVMLRRELARLLLSLDSPPPERQLRVMVDPTASPDATALRLTVTGPEDGEHQ